MPSSDPASRVHPPASGHPPESHVPIIWRTRSRVVSIDHPVVLGIVNVTPDSFSDGGKFFSVDTALAHAAQLLDDGADVLDIGGESTRPQGALPVEAGEESRRVVPVVAALRRRYPEILISVDTVKSDVAYACLAEGADIINDVSGFRLDPKMAQVCAVSRAGVILMHSRGSVSDMATFAHADYGADVVGEVVTELSERLRLARAAGIPNDAIVVDPGIGFSKRTEHSVAVLGALYRIVELGFPVSVGVSRKRFVGELSGVQEPAGRVFGSTGANVMALAAGARIFRVHDVAPARQALDVAWAILERGARG